MLVREKTQRNWQKLDKPNKGTVVFRVQIISEGCTSKCSIEARVFWQLPISVSTPLVGQVKKK